MWWGKRKNWAFQGASRRKRRGLGVSLGFGRWYKHDKKENPTEEGKTEKKSYSYFTVLTGPA